MSGYPTARAVSKPAGYDRVLVDGVDVTYFRGAETVIGDILLTEPFAYGPTTLAFPRIAADLEPLGVGELSWIRDGAAVVIQRVDDPTAETPVVLATDYRGVVLTKVVDGRNLSLEIGGQLSGPASLINKQQPVYRRLKDVGFWFANVVETLRLHPSSRFGPTTGIQITEGGGGTLFAWAQDVCAMSQTNTGAQRTIMPTTWGGSTWGFNLKDTTTKHVTLFTDDARVVPRLRDDLSEQPNRFYGTGVTPDGVRWRNSRWPGVIQGPAPDYPNAGGATIGVGDTDADTDSGEGVTVLSVKLVEMHYLTITEDFDYAAYTTDTADAVKELQDDAGLAQTGTMNPATWDALFDVSVTGSSLSDARIEPIVQSPKVRRFDLSANGSIIGINDAFDAHVLPVDRNIDFGPHVTKARGIAYARGQMTKLAGKNWTGTIELNGLGGFAGEWGPEDADFLNDPETGPAHIMPQLDIRPGMNAWLPLFDGGTLVHISGVQVSRRDRKVTLTVDTMSRDFLELAAIIARNVEARRHPRREWYAENRSQRASGNLVQRDEWFGKLTHNVQLTGGEWNIVDVIVGQHGQVNRVDIHLVNAPAKFAVMFCSRQKTARRIARRIANPLAVASESWLETNDVQDWQESRQILYAAGDGKQPCGYWPKRHRDDNGTVTSHPITGRHLDDATWTYICSPDEPAIIKMAIFPDRDCTVKRGQILWAQEDDVV